MVFGPLPDKPHLNMPLLIIYRSCQQVAAYVACVLPGSTLMALITCVLTAHLFVNRINLLTFAETIVEVCYE